MRVLALLHTYPPIQSAGAEMMVHTLLRALVDDGHQADVVLSRDAGEPYDLDGVRVHPHRSKNDVFDHLHHADVLVTHLENTPRATILGSLNKVPVVHVIHNTFEPTRRWLERGPVTLAVFNSQWMLEDYRTHMQAPMPPHVVVRPPVLLDEYRTTPGDKVTLINLYLNKGSATFWALAERMPDVKFLAVVGGYGAQDIRDLPNVEVVEHVPGHEMRDRVYAQTRLLLVPSIYESWGRVAVEAMASGIPVIAHPTPGLKECLADAGTFADRNDLDAWEHEVRRLLDGRRWRPASRRAAARAAELDPTPDLNVWREALTRVALTRVRARK
ncbi:MAG: glycosyltransferase family 4 protein [Actinophytocola sp.]|uniref:glycosyltransferase family 4 protein n=1 Tax=Actinophytocola sp. TaxID=1872138 RepID=UPI003D6B94C1